MNFLSPFWDDVSSTAKNFVRALLTVSEDQRLTAEQALSHEWMKMEIREPESGRHILRDQFGFAPALLQSMGNVPEIVQTRMKELAKHLEERLSKRPNIRELRKSGIYKSFTQSE